MVEIWKDIPGYEGIYAVSNFGKVKSLQRTRKGSYGSIRIVYEKILNHKIDKDGYHIVTLSKEGKTKCIGVHRLVAQAFLPNIYNLPMVNHKDENPSNNFVDNLEWCTAKYNNNYGTAIERRLETKLKNGVIKNVFPKGLKSSDPKLYYKIKDETKIKNNTR